MRQSAIAAARRDPVRVSIAGMHQGNFASKPDSPAARVRVVTVDSDHAGQRLDNFLVACFRDVPRSRIYRSVRTGEVRVNRGRARQTYRLKEGDQVRLPPLSSSAGSRPVRPQETRLALLRGAVLLEDNDLLVINKPAGLPVHAGSGHDFGLIELLKADPERGPGFIELVHRLDQDTSGCLLLAKRRSVLVALHEQLREGEMDKRYRVLLHGRWRGGGRRVDAPVARSVKRSGERVVRLDPHGQAARTAFTPLCPGERVSLMEAHPKTGRTHQIRVHAAQALKMPVVGDPRYGDWALNRELVGKGLARMFLHASRLGFTHPRSGMACRVEAPLESALYDMLRHFGLVMGESGPSS